MKVDVELLLYWVFYGPNFNTDITNIRCQGTSCFTFISSIQSTILWGIYYLLLIDRQSFITIKGNL